MAPACLGLGAPGRHRCFIFVGNPAYTIMFMIKSLREETIKN